MSLLIFTLDFHQLLRGELQQDSDCQISYDPQRVAAGVKNFVHGSPDFKFTAHIQFDSHNGLDVPLYSPSGITRTPDIALDGSGSMLSGQFKVPGGTIDIAIWFTMEERNGRITYDSNHGSNYHFRTTTVNAPFAKAGFQNLAMASAGNTTQVPEGTPAFLIPDVQITKASIVNIKEAGMGKLSFAATCISSVNQLYIRYRVLNYGNSYNEKIVQLSPLSDFGEELTLWGANDVNIPYAAVVVYDIQYYISNKDGNESYCLNNNGYYYSAQTQA